MAIIPYEIERTITRTIHKFNIVGSEYRLKIGVIPEGLTYHELLTAVHDVFTRKLHLVSPSHFFHYTARS
jgi:hypothetical protein